VEEFCSFVAREYEKRGRLEKASPRPDAVKVTYHDSCHLKRVLGVSEEPRKLIESVAGCELVEMKDADACCGMSGAFGVTHSNLSIPILKRKMKNIEETGAGIVACACSGCMVQLRGGIDRLTPDKKMKHIADILAENISN